MKRGGSYQDQFGSIFLKNILFAILQLLGSKLRDCKVEMLALLRYQCHHLEI